jgi:hypothetical protein
MRRISAAVVCCLTLLAGWGAPGMLAQDAATGYIVQIRAGSCADPGDGIAQLDDLTLPGAASVGAQDAAIAGSAYSVAAVSLDALTGSATALFVLDSTSHSVVACGEIGGAIGADGSLSIGLRPQNDAGFSGIAYLSPAAGNPAQTGISTFLARTGATSGSESSDAPPMEAQAYSTMVNNQLTVLVGSLQRIDALFNNPAPTDSGWLSQVSGELFLWKLLYGLADDANPPAAFADFDQQYLGALELLDSAADDISQGLKSSDETKLSSASTKIQNAVQELRGLNPADVTSTPEAGTPTS